MIINGQVFYHVTDDVSNLSCLQLGTTNDFGLEGTIEHLSDWGNRCGTGRYVFYSTPSD